MFAEVPVVPVVVPLAVVVTVLLLWHLHRRRLMSVPRGAVAVALGVYAAGVVANTVFPIYLDKPSGTAPWDAFVNLTPLAGYEAADALMNIGVFVPLGILLALAWPAAGPTRVLGTASAFSLVIEVSQYLTAHFLGGGHVADVNDFAFNVAGAAIGLLLLITGRRVPALRLISERLSWMPSPARTETEGLAITTA